ncbi:hypothetical protein HYFRA_00000274 [Hymenoscyphus fraxineus]|uniref:AA1-like domain-containing protein n=1 Tax=Hymenoscyphus fraxineus TaxID=746836 RepID=A0A9N9L5J7_9HELO|nr:hypothetical protein HYFRA_00000274 [Hymenoscyphus fraxineus]
MHLTNLKLLTLSALATLSTCQSTIPWKVKNFNVHHVPGTMIGVWSFDISDDSPAPYGFKTKCTYYTTAAPHFAVDAAPVNVACEDKSVAFTFEQPVLRRDFVLSVLHTWGGCGTSSQLGCIDIGFWTFSEDDVRGQLFDKDGESVKADFMRSQLMVYPQRFVTEERTKEMVRALEGKDVDAGEEWSSV